MAEFDLHNAVKTMPAIHPVSSSAGANGVSIDTKGCESVEFFVQTGAMTSGTLTVSMEHADDNGSGSAGTFAAVTGDDILGANLSFVTATPETNTAKRIGYRGKKQWVRLVTAGTFSIVIHSAVCVLGNPKRMPVA